MGYDMAVAYNPLCEADCPEHCSQPWKIFIYQGWINIGNISDKDLFAVPKPQFVSKEWKIDRSFKMISGSLIQFSFRYYYQKYNSLNLIFLDS